MAVALCDRSGDVAADALEIERVYTYTASMQLRSSQKATCICHSFSNVSLIPVAFGCHQTGGEVCHVSERPHVQVHLSSETRNFPFGRVALGPDFKLYGHWKPFYITMEPPLSSSQHNSRLFY